MGDKTGFLRLGHILSMVHQTPDSFCVGSARSPGTMQADEPTQS